MNQKIIVSDFDGVIGNSLQVSMNILRKIVDLFDKTAEITSFGDFYRLLGKKSVMKGVNEIESNTLRELFRIMYRHNSNEIILFEEVINIYSELIQKPIIVSSSYSDAIIKILNDKRNYFKEIYGYESGHKKDILKNLNGVHPIIYISDTFRDVILCKELGIPIIATCWGYDNKDKIFEVNPDYIAYNFANLREILIKLKYYVN